MAEETYDSGDSEEKDPENQKDTIEYWRRWIKAAEKAAHTHWCDAERAWDEYENKDRSVNKSDGYSAVESGSRIYWSSCKTMEPAFYSKTPKMVTEREFGSNDLPALAACRIAEGLGKHHTGTSRVTNSRFDECMNTAVQEFMHAGRVANQIMYEKQLAEDPETGELVAIPETQKIYPVALLYNKTLHSPQATNQYEITEKAIYFFLPKADAINRFGADVCKNIKWKTRGAGKYDVDEQTDTEDYTGSFVEGWECHDIDSKMVRWYSDQCDGFLDEQLDPDGYYDFWNTTDYIIDSKPSKSLYPTPAHTQLAPLIGQLHLLCDRIYDLVDAIRPRALVDGDEEVVAALDSLDSSMFLAAGSLQGIIEKGGLKNMVLFVPVRELVEALNTSIAIQQQFKGEFNEAFGLPDIIRGISDPLDSEGTNAQNLSSAHDRFKNVKKQVATLASQTVCKMIEISVHVYAPEKIARIVGFDFWPEQLKQHFLTGLELLKDPEQGIVRIDIDSESLTFRDQRREREEQRFISDLINSSLNNIANMLQISPQFASISLKLLVDTLERTGEGKYLTDEVKQAVNALLEQAQQPPPEPQPDPIEMHKLELEGKRIQIEERKVVGNEQIKVLTLEQKGIQNNLRSIELQMNAVLERNQQQLDAQIEARKLEQGDAKLQLEAQKAALEEAVQRFMMHIEAMTLEIKKTQTQMQATEMLMEETRLAREVDNNKVVGMIEAIKTPEPVAAATAPPINVTVDMGKRGRKVGSVNYDELGNAQFVVDEEPEGL